MPLERQVGMLKLLTCASLNCVTLRLLGITESQALPQLSACSLITRCLSLMRDPKFCKPYLLTDPSISSPGTPLL